MEEFSQKYFSLLGLYSNLINKLAFNFTSFNWPNKANYLAAYEAYCSIISNPTLIKKITNSIADNFLNDNMPERLDKRFQSNLWIDNAIYRLIISNYLSYVKLIEDNIEKIDIPSLKNPAKKKFFIKYILDSLSPANFLLTNPEAIKKLIETKGDNIIDGLANFIKDTDQNCGINISTTDDSYFQLGINIANTKGNVIFQNKMLQLIHYIPVRKKIYETPIFIIPPWINKYYILDLNEDKSFVKWLLESGHDVFLVSWVNPDSNYQDVDFFDYLTLGLEPAIKHVEEKYGHKKLNMIGYCIGGTLLSCLASYYAQKNNDIINSLTFFTTLIDFSNAGIIKELIDLEEVNNITSKHGFYSGKEIYKNFALLRANDLYWPFYINNYLLGSKPNAFDILFWNADSTNLPEKMSKYYLKNMYQKNNLVKSNKLKLKNIPIDIAKISVPCYFLAAEEDHIAPWQAVYDGYSKICCEKKFVLAGSGHVAGIINHPKFNKYYYYDDIKLDSNKNLAASSKKNPGSWWPDWLNWVNKMSGKLVDPLLDNSLEVIEEAPGSYVMVKC